MVSLTMTDPVPGGRALGGLAAELAAADELITELVAENEELRSRLAQGPKVAPNRA